MLVERRWFGASLNHSAERSLRELSSRRTVRFALTFALSDGLSQLAQFSNGGAAENG